LTTAPWLGYLLALIASAGLTLALTPVAIRVAHRFGVLDHPGGHKAHTAPTPYLGGVAVSIALVTVATGGAMLRGEAVVTRELLVLLAIASGYAVVGLLDDLVGLPVPVRLALQTLGAVALLATGTGTNLFPGHVVPDAVITVVWVVGITNAFNLLDNMDGLSSVIAAIASFGFGIIGAANGQFLVATLAFALAGATAAFLRFNRAPARIYLGDAGSLFLGVVLAVVGIRLAFTTDPVVAALIPILVLTVPVLDTTLVVVDRLRHGISPFHGGQDHLSHRLVAIGLPVPIAVGTIAVLGAAHAWMALVLSRVDLATALLGAGLVAAIDLVLFVLLLRVPIHRDTAAYVIERRPADDDG
jgi:UDP-GlcNAc:undecaprenyl-phosphate/decaprenyl-phosphate GlcNAc-1-phosphate transferase